MKFGHFDDKRQEYIINRPDTPKSWSNYLGSTKYGAIITNNAGGYSFYRSGGMGRFIRMRFNSIPMDQPGRYIYFRDNDDGDFWSGSWQPVGKPLDDYESTCRHGMGYTIINSKYKNIESEITYFVPMNKNYEVWKVKVRNNGNKPRNLSAYSYTEYAGNWHALDDLLNIQYVQYISQMQVIDGIIDHGTNINLPNMPDNFKEKDQGRHTFQALVGLPVTGYDTDREKFLGDYRTYANPEVVEKGESKNSLGYGDNPCGSLRTDFLLKPGEEKEFLIILGIGKADEEGKKVASSYSNLKKTDRELDELKQYWKDRIQGLKANTPDDKLNSTINTWGIYNSIITFSWSRAASLVYTGIDRDGLGYRDTVQDFLGVMHTITDEVKDRLALMITGQASTGGAVPVILPIAHSPGEMESPKESEYRSDDCLWLFNAIPDYVKETGDLDFYKKVLPYADKGEDTVFKHLKRAIEFNLERSGEHGFPCGLSADWNDCLEFGDEGESIFVTLQLRYALNEYVEIGKLLEDDEEVAWGEKLLSELDAKINKYAWDGEWFMRGYGADGQKFGSRDSTEGKIYMNPQAWAIYSGLATEEQGQSAMRNVQEKLATKYGVMICDPPYTDSDYNIVRAQLMNPGLKENAGIFMHTQGWAVIAEALLGHGNQAYQYVKSFLPAYYNDKAEIREIEPYVMCQSTHSKYSPKFGTSRIPWLSGSASWSYYAITRYVLGIRPDYDGLKIDPCIPAEWDGFEVSRRFRDNNFDITVKNTNSSQKGIKEITINGEKIEGNTIPVNKMKEENKVEVIM